MNRGLLPTTRSDRDMVDGIRQILGKDPLYNMSAGGTDTERFYQPPAYTGPEQTRRHPTA
jgi:hypothetical protein